MVTHDPLPAFISPVTKGWAHNPPRSFTSCTPPLQTLKALLVDSLPRTELAVHLLAVEADLAELAEEELVAAMMVHREAIWQRASTRLVKIRKALCAPLQVASESRDIEDLHLSLDTSSCFSGSTRASRRNGPPQRKRRAAAKAREQARPARTMPTNEVDEISCGELKSFGEQGLLAHSHQAQSPSYSLDDKAKTLLVELGFSESLSALMSQRYGGYLIDKALELTHEQDPSLWM